MTGSGPLAAVWNAFFTSQAVQPTFTALLLLVVASVFPRFDAPLRRSAAGIGIVLALTFVYAIYSGHLLGPFFGLALAAAFMLQKALAHEIEGHGQRNTAQVVDDIRVQREDLETVRARLAEVQEEFYQLNTRYDVVRQFGNTLHFEDAWAGIVDAAWKLVGGKVRLYLPQAGDAFPSGLFPASTQGDLTLPDENWRAAAAGHRVAKTREDGSRSWWIPLAIGTQDPAVLNLALPPNAPAATEAIDILAVQLSLLLEKIRLYHEVEHASRTDLLTGLLHHSSFKTHLDEEIERARRTDRPLSLIMLDIDHFKSVNDTYGHRVGDQVLIQIARHLRETLRISDIVARYGGEEFALLLPATGLEGAREIADRLRVIIQKAPIVAHTETEEHVLSKTISAGLAVFPVHAAQASELLEKADTALYQAKRLGRNRVELAES